MSFHYRLIKLKDKRIPRLCEVYYDKEKKPWAFCEFSFIEIIKSDLLIPLWDLFRRWPPLDESDFTGKSPNIMEWEDDE